MTGARARTDGALAILLAIYATLIAVTPQLWARLILVAPLIGVPFVLWTLARPARWILAFLCCALLLPPLPIPLGDSGPHLCLAIAALGLLAGVLRMRDWSFRVEPLHVAMIAYPCVLGASVAFAAIYSGPAIAAASLTRVALFAISIYVFFYTAFGPGSRNTGNTFRNLRLVYLAALASAIFASIDFYFQLPAPAGFGPQYVWLDSGVYRRAQGVFYEASTLGNFCTFFLVVTAAALARSAPVSRLLLFAGSIAFTLALMLSFSRASLVNLIIALAAMLYLHRRRMRTRLVAIVPAAVAAGAAVAYFFFPRFSAVYLGRLDASVTYFFAATEGVLSGRVESWRVLGRFLMEQPWHAIFGVGYKTLPYSDFTGSPVVADNAYLSALVETGIIGVAALLLFSFAILRISWRASRHQDDRAAFFGTVVFCFWTGEMVQMMSGDLLTYWRVLPVYLWALALAARYSSHEPASARPVQ